MPGSSGRPRVILLVEDDQGDQELTRRALQRLPVRHHLEVVANGEDALDYLCRRGHFAEAVRPDLVLLDLNLPGLDGKQVLQRLRAEPALVGLPVVCLTTSSQDDDVRQSYRLGANSYIAKPASMEGFSALVEAVHHYWFDTVLLPDGGKSDGT
ncbi:MAG: response regulator [Planctomycetes bacterium]|nr:response regulator [Planctomycetota bacterium]